MKNLKYFLTLILSLFFIVVVRAFDVPYVKSVYSLPLSFDPIKVNDTASLFVLNQIFDGLVKYGPNLQIEGSIAERWDIKDNGKTFIFNIKKGVFFHNGDLLTAKDVVFSLRRTISKESIVRNVFDVIDDDKNAGLKATDNYTVRIKLKYPFYNFLNILAGSNAKILPNKLLSKASFFDHPIGTGIYKFVSLSKGKKEILLEKNASYFATPALLTRIILKEDIEKEAISLAQKGKIHDLSNWPLDSNNSIFNYGKKIVSPVAATWIIGLNTTKVPFDDIQIRKSFKNCFDTDLFRKSFFESSLPAKSLVPYGIPYFPPTKEKCDSRKIASGDITIVIPIELALADAIKKFIENEYRKKGWKVIVKALKWDELMKGYNDKTFQAFLVSMNMDYPDPEFLFRGFQSSSPDNFAGYKDKKLDILIDKMRQENNGEKRSRLNLKIAQYIEDMALSINLFHPTANYWISKCVDGFVPNILADVFIDYSKVSLKKGCL